MITLLSAIVGLLGSALPDLIGIFKAKQKLNYDLAVLEVQERMAAAGQKFKMEELSSKADIAEVKALHDEFAQRKETWKWVEALISSVRPILTYAFFILYATVKINALILAMGALDGSLALALSTVWREEDQAIFSTIIAFWFGGRQMQRFRKGQ